MKRFSFCVSLIFVFLSLVFVPAHVVFASELTSASVTATSLGTSASANYKFYFSASAATWDEGETMTIAFPSGYSLSSFSEDDVDISDDATDLSTASNCAGTEQVAVTAAGNSLAFEMCVGDGGAIASGSLIEIEVGLNASAYGTGVHQVTNPSVAGSYFLGITGTFGNTGSLIVPIVASSGSGVSVTVSSGGSDSDECVVACTPSTGDSDPPPIDDVPVDPPVDPPVEPLVEPPVIPPADPPIDTPDDSPDDLPTDSTADSPSSSDQSPDASGGSGASTLAYDIDVSAEDIVLPVVDGTVTVISESSARIEILVQEGVPTSVYFDVGGDRIVFTDEGGGVWGGIVPIGLANASGTLVVENGLGVVVTSPIIFDVASGAVYEIIDGQTSGVGGVTVTVLYENGTVWDANAYGQSSSRITNEQGGGISWYVPNGTYILRLEKEGYEISETTVAVTRNVLAPTLFIARKGETVVFPGEGGVISEDGSSENGVVNVSDQGFISEILRRTAQITSGEVAVVAAPVALTVGAAAFIAAGGGQLWLLLYSFFSQPFLFFARKKYQKVGVTYHSITKIPLDLVTIRVYEIVTNRLVKSLVSNARGEFLLSLEKPGRYRIQAAKQGFVFPSAYLQGAKEDGQYSDVYTGQEIEVAQDARMLAVAIPLDVRETIPVPVRTLEWQRMRRGIALALSPVSVFLSLGIFVFNIGVFTGIFLAIQILLYACTWKIARKKHSKTWGIVYDERTRRPVGNVVIRLFEPKYNKLVDSLLSDAHGRYVFALGPNEYYMTFTKEGYGEATIKPIDFTARKGISFFGINIPLRRSDTHAHG